MSDGIIRSRRSNGWKIDLKWSRNGHGLPFDKHLTTGSFLGTRDVPQKGRQGVGMDHARMTTNGSDDSLLPSRPRPSNDRFVTGTDCCDGNPRRRKRR
jgi:hypothetical protein